MKIAYEKSYNAYQEGRVLMEKGDYAGAIKLFNMSGRLFPHFKTFELLGECLLNVNKPLDAIVALAAAAGLGTKPFRARYLLGKAFSQVGEELDAIEHLKEALHLKSDYKAAKELLKSLKNKDQ